MSVDPLLGAPVFEVEGQPRPQHGNVGELFRHGVLAEFFQPQHLAYDFLQRPVPQIHWLGRFRRDPVVPVARPADVLCAVRELVGLCRQGFPAAIAFDEQRKVVMALALAGVAGLVDFSVLPPLFLRPLRAAEVELRLFVFAVSVVQVGGKLRRPVFDFDAVAGGELLLRFPVGFGIDDGGVGSLGVVHRQFAVVLYQLVGDVTLREEFLHQAVAGILFLTEHIADDPVVPSFSIVIVEETRYTLFAFGNGFV